MRSELERALVRLVHAFDAKRSITVSRHRKRNTFKHEASFSLELVQALNEAREQLRVGPAPIPLLLPCPACGKRHVDVGEWATRVHHTHACQECGHVWRPAIEATVGVRFLPGFKNEDE